MKLLILWALFFCSVSGVQKGFRFQERHQSARIIGGHNAKIGEFPHQVSVQWGHFDRYTHVCGGSVISETWVLTAAHCKTELPDGEFITLAGITNLQDTNYLRSFISKVIIHPDYKGGVNPNDIALMNLNYPLLFFEKCRPVRLPEDNAIPFGEADISGWGSVSTSQNPQMPQDLQTSKLKIISLDECKQAVENLTGTSEPLSSTNVCTGPLDGGLGTCTGDAGGPLTQNQTVVGVVSWGFIPCGNRGVPSIFTQVSSFKQFIKDNVKNLPYQ